MSMSITIDSSHCTSCGECSRECHRHLIVLMAQTLGLGSCFVSLAQNAINASRTCRKILNMSPADRIHAVVVLGYPAVQFHRAIPRESKTFQWLDT